MTHATLAVLAGRQEDKLQADTRFWAVGDGGRGRAAHPALAFK